MIGDEIRIRGRVMYKGVTGFPAYLVGANGSVWSKQRKSGWRNMKLQIGSGGYQFVKLHNGGKMCQVRVHRLVLQAFVGPCPEEMECRHLNGIRTDNRRENLAWGTRQENSHDKKLHGTDLSGEKNVNAKLTIMIVKKIRSLHSRGYTYHQLSRMFQVSKWTIRDVVKRWTWGHVA